jgi:sulfur-oxidizing protein SoxZ
MAAGKEPRRRLKIVPATARKGEIVTVKTLAEHEMASGVRYVDDSPVLYPRFILNRLICRYNGRQVFVSDWSSGISANPYLAFKLRSEESGTIEIEWVDDDGQSTFASTEITVLEEETATTPDEGATGG